MGTEILHCIFDISCFLEAVRGRHLIIKVDLFLVEYEHVASCNNITLHVDKITASIDQPAVLVIQFAIGCLQDDKVTLLISLKLAEDLLNIEIGQLGHATSCQSLALTLGFGRVGHLGLV